MTLDAVEVSRRVVETKQMLRDALPGYREVFAEVADVIGREAEAIARRAEAGDPIVPSVQFDDIVAGRVPAETVAAIKTHGCAVVRGVYPRARAEAWDRQLTEYLTSNDYIEHAKAKIGLDKYFSRMKSGKPQIYGIYWSRPQVEARQGEELAATRAWLNGLWRWQGHFVADRECTYADRIRQREPGDATLGLSPHCDGGTIERWIDPGYRHVYRHVLSGDWRAHDPWDGDGRTATQEIPSPAVCQMFRTYQGWTALTPQGPGDGTLQLVPMTNAMVYVLLRALQDDVPEDDLCGAEAGTRAVCQREVARRPVARPGADPAGRAGRHRLVASGRDPRGRECASRDGLFERHLHRLRPGLRQEQRLPAGPKGSVPRRPQRARLRRGGLRTGVLGSRAGGRSDPARPQADGVRSLVGD